eukprot:TRINITY_DN4300_c0_g1_i3.p1 TRINITY_DN4300_c0_g1~~TRINITY_DN4300_c0_g1_i3.p1  ORF type:complete len:669 (-),score=85.70 TRINITY_DN4300_c0_g1_i3:219-2225(-)
MSIRKSTVASFVSLSGFSSQQGKWKFIVSYCLEARCFQNLLLRYLSPFSHVTTVVSPSFVSSCPRALRLSEEGQVIPLSRTTSMAPSLDSEPSCRLPPPTSNEGFDEVPFYSSSRADFFDVADNVAVDVSFMIPYPKSPAHKSALEYKNRLDVLLPPSSRCPAFTPSSPPSRLEPLCSLEWRRGLLSPREWTQESEVYQLHLSNPSQQSHTKQLEHLHSTASNPDTASSPSLRPSSSPTRAASSEPVRFIKDEPLSSDCPSVARPLFLSPAGDSLRDVRNFCTDPPLPSPFKGSSSSRPLWWQTSPSAESGDPVYQSTSPSRWRTDLRTCSLSLPSCFNAFPEDDESLVERSCHIPYRALPKARVLGKTASLSLREGREWQAAMAATTSRSRLEDVGASASMKPRSLHTQSQNSGGGVHSPSKLLGGMPAYVKIVEVGPRDGLQNESTFVPTSIKVELIERLARAGLPVVEATSFVSPKWVPQLADAPEVMAKLPHQQSPSTKFPVLTPNLRGFDAAVRAGAKEVAVFASATESFSQQNINCSIADSLERFALVCAAAKEQGVPVRGYVSCVVGCPVEGPVEPRQVARVAKALYNMGCYEISLGDTIGIGTPGSVAAMLEAVTAVLPVECLAVHMHDTYGQALANILLALQVPFRSWGRVRVNACNYS